MKELIKNKLVNLWIVLLQQQEQTKWTLLLSYLILLLYTVLFLFMFSGQNWFRIKSLINKLKTNNFLVALFQKRVNEQKGKLLKEILGN